MSSFPLSSLSFFALHIFLSSSTFRLSPTPSTSPLMSPSSVPPFHLLSASTSPYLSPLCSFLLDFNTSNTMSALPLPLSTLPCSLIPPSPSLPSASHLIFAPATHPPSCPSLPLLFPFQILFFILCSLLHHYLLHVAFSIMSSSFPPSSSPLSLPPPFPMPPPSSSPALHHIWQPLIQSSSNISALLFSLFLAFVQFADVLHGFVINLPLLLSPPQATRDQ